MNSGVIDTADMHSGGIDTGMTCLAVSLPPLWQAQWWHWHRCATKFVDYLREFEVIFEKALTRVSGAQGKLFDKKKLRLKISCQGPLDLEKLLVMSKNNDFLAHAY
jgi:hypothetical protein